MYYQGIQSEEGRIVREEDALSYALERCLLGTKEDQEEFRDALIEWFYSGNWIRREEDDEMPG